MADHSDDCWNIVLQFNSELVKFCIDTAADVKAIPEQICITTSPTTTQEVEIPKHTLATSKRNF